MTSTDPYHFEQRVVLAMFDTSIEADAAIAFADGYLCDNVIVTYMELIHYDDWVSGRRDGDSDRLVAFAQKYGASFKDTNFDLLFRAEYKMLKGPLPQSFKQLIWQCWNFNGIKHPKN